MRELSRAFSVDVDGAEPLNRCIEWVRSRPAVDGHFRIFSKELPTRARTYAAVTLSALAAWFATLGTVSHVHEIVTGPVHGYADVDVPLASPVDARDAERRFDAFVTAVRSQAALVFHAVGDVDVLVLDSSSPTKFSRHVHVRMRRASDGETLVFANARACRSFMEHAQRVAGVERLLDVGVYSARASLRTAYSTKPDEPTRPLRPLGAAPSAPRSFDVFARALVSAPDVSDARRWLRFVAPGDTTRRAPALVAAAAALAPTGSAYALLARARALVPALRTLETTGVQRVGSLLRVKCASCVCGACGVTHKSNTIYYTIDLERGRYQQNCFSKKHPDKRLVWHTHDGAPVSTPSPSARSALTASTELAPLFTGVPRAAARKRSHEQAGLCLVAP